MKRTLCLASAAAILAVTLTACMATPGPTTNITSTSATLNATGSCSGGTPTPCEWYWQWGTGGSYQNKSAIAGPFTISDSNVPMTYSLTGLRPNTTYNWQLCGEGDNVASFLCLTAQTFTTASTSPTTTTTTTVPPTTTTTQPNTPGAIAPVGSLAAASAPAGASSGSLSVDPQNVGDLMLFGIEDSNTTLPTVSSVSGGGVSSWTLLASDFDAGYTQDGDEIWEGVVTTPGPSTITMTLNGYSDGDDLLAQEFTAGSPVTWSLDKSGTVTGTEAQSFNYPSLTPARSSELYFGMGNAINNTQLVGEGTPGVTYVNTGLECVSLVAYDTNTSSALAPAVANSSGGGNGETALAVLVQS